MCLRQIHGFTDERPKRKPQSWVWSENNKLNTCKDTIRLANTFNIIAVNMSLDTRARFSAPPSYRSLAQPQLQPQAYQTDAITPAESEVTTTPPSYRSLVQPQVYRTDVVRPGSYATLSAVVVAICGGLALCSLPCSISAMVLSAMVS